MIAAWLCLLSPSAIDPAKAIQAFHEDYSKAIKRDGGAATDLLKRNLMPEFTLVRHDGSKLGKVQWIAEVSKQVTNQHITRNRCRLSPVVKAGDAYQVMVRDDWEISRPGKDGKASLAGFSRITTETWVLVGKSPRISQARENGPTAHIQGGESFTRQLKSG